MTRQPHPAALLFPMMSDSELDELAADIAQNGLLEPIVEHEGQVLDGRNREEACARAGVEPRFRTWNGEAESPTAFVASQNIHRRHLTTGQKAAIAVELLPMLAAETKEAQREAGREHGRGKLPPALEEAIAPLQREASAKAANLVGVGRSTVEYAKAVQKRDPAEFERIKQGETAVEPAYERAMGRSAPHRVPRKSPLDKYEKALAMLVEAEDAWTDETLYRLAPAKARRMAKRTARVAAFLTKTEPALRAKDFHITVTRSAIN